ncbi:MAG: hypothetical protein ABIF04_07610 [Chloroflexota bacterium]
MFSPFLFSDHLRPALGTGLVNATLAGHVRLFVPTIWADTIARRAGAGLVPATSTSPLACSPATALSLASTASLPSALAESIA